MPGPGQTGTPVKPCVVRYSSVREDFNPNKVYYPGDYVKVGPYAVLSRWTATTYTGMVVIMRYGDPLIRTATGLTVTEWLVSPTAAAGWSFSAATRVRQGTKFGSVQGWNPPPTPTAQYAWLATQTDVVAGFNLSDAIFAFNESYGAGDSFPSASDHSDTFRGSDTVYKCIRQSNVNYPYSPEGLRQDLQTSTLSLFNSDYFTALSASDELTYALGGSAPSDNGTPRTDCSAESSYEALVCGRCGRLI